MGAIAYKVVRHDGGWAYLANETFSEPCATWDKSQVAGGIPGVVLAASVEHQP
jgi:hypothetical protein